MGYFGGDWTYSEYRDTVDKAIEEKRDVVSLDTEHCSCKSDEDITKWAKEDGYEVKCKMDSIVIYLKKQ